MFKNAFDSNIIWESSVATFFNESVFLTIVVKFNIEQAIKKYKMI